MIHARKLFAAGCMVCAGTTAQAADVSDASRVPFLRQPGRDGYAKYLEANPQKAFAVCLGGAWAYRSGREVARAAAADAVAAARKNSKGMPCVVYAVNDKVVTGSALQTLSSEELRQVLASTRLWKPAFADEDRNESISPQTTLRQQQLHAPTPVEIPGAKVITTEALRQALLSERRPVVVDIRAKPEATIPGAHVNNPLGTDFSGSGGRLAADFLAEVAPDKSTPIVFYCVNWECWMSYNATLRAIEAGYRNAMWYRGGIAAWFEAGLPLEPK